jgi:uncharacterized protein (DUF58 family)
MLYILLTVVLGVVGVNSGNNLLYVAVAGLLALLVASGTLGYLNIHRLTAAVRVPGEIHAGRPATILLELTNSRGRLPAYLLQCRGGEGGEERLVRLGPGESATLMLPVTFDRRGRRPLPPLHITSPFPFGLIVRGGDFDTGLTCVVFPTPLPVPWPLVERAEIQGEESSQARAGTGGDHRGFRAYLPGDPISRIFWKGWLRHRRWLTREFEAEGAPPVFFSWQEVPGPGEEERLGQLAWLVRTGIRRCRAVGLRLPGAEIPPGVGAPHRRRLLTRLALHGQEDAGAGG